MPRRRSLSATAIGHGARSCRPRARMITDPAFYLVSVVAVILLWVGGIWLAGRLLSHRAPGSQGGHA